MLSIKVKDRVPVDRPKKAQDEVILKNIESRNLIDMLHIAMNLGKLSSSEKG